MMGEDIFNIYMTNGSGFRGGPKQLIGKVKIVDGQPVFIYKHSDLPPKE